MQGEKRFEGKRKETKRGGLIYVVIQKQTKPSRHGEIGVEFSDAEPEAVHKEAMGDHGPYFTRDQRRNRPPIRRTVLKKPDVEKLMKEQTFAVSDFPPVYLNSAVEEDINARGGGYQQFDMMEEVLHCVFSSGDISLNDGSHRLIATIFNIPLNSCFALLLFNYRQDLEMVYEIS
ncbi:hypothetical protein JHK82_046902 [Glycine max]|nr:hypothetical protein JHK86_046791 [Glycine max]KAG4932585.1 hypothetical protein JHK87_046587 [Glycine soja]KAG4942711.1 hypothetical protein JHK85_047357 [Glycine max]KAG5097048.1 hypothetical protein JHK82_046902 [Glycine max]